MTIDPAVIAAYDQMLAHLNESHPGHSEGWYQTWMRRAGWYTDHQGDMSECPYDFEEEN